MPRVSVLLPTHNRRDVVSLAVQSVLDQTESDFELLVVADGCTDDTCALIAGLRDPRIRVFDLPKAPHFGYANRNVALREARGEFLAFMAHDDLLFPDHLDQLVRTLEAGGCDWAYSRPLWVSTDGVIVPYATNLTVADELEDFLAVGNTIPASCVVYRRSCVARYGHWPENVPSAADWRYWIAIIEGGQRRNLTYLRTPTCLHFSANWKRSRHAAVGEVRTWLAIADSVGWWPAVLKWPIPAGTAEQKVIGEAMRLGGMTWAQDVRSAVETVLDRVAWDDIRAVRPTLHQRDIENRQLAAELTALATELSGIREKLAACQRVGESCAQGLALAERERDALRNSLAHVLASTSWRITAPMRTLKRLLAAKR